ncbi:uncharacterized protein LOC129732159 [Wyeomyia smithii]|uniref:uncharacterized protein LOC129732159 n=1 Tax=Wyeomyia smithii TaxID=174621 RepID=UPI00246817F7|nr:uncharacterized protein LOC129732159 [Wyeomyia smithii]
MKVFIALFVVALTAATQASYLPTAGLGWNSWNDWNDWDDHHGVAGYPYAKSWSSSLYNDDGWNGHFGSWGLPWGSYGAGWGHSGLVKSVVPVGNQIAATPGSLHVAPVPLGPAQEVITH